MELQRDKWQKGQMKFAVVKTLILKQSTCPVIKDKYLVCDS